MVDLDHNLVQGSNKYLTCYILIVALVKYGTVYARY
jgi:hypothetical protein